MNSSPLNCTEARDLITLEVDHRLSDDDCIALQIHLALCSECRKEYHAEKEVKDLLSKHCRSVKIPDQLSYKLSDLLSNPEKMTSLSAGMVEVAPDPIQTHSIFQKKRYLAAVTLSLILIFLASVYFLIAL